MTAAPASCRSTAAAGSSVTSASRASRCCNHLAANGWVGVNANYRLSPRRDVPRAPHRPEEGDRLVPRARRRARRRSRLPVRHRRLGRRAPVRARRADARTIPSTSPASSPSTRRCGPRCRSTASTTSRTATARGRSDTVTQLLRTDGDEEEVRAKTRRRSRRRHRWIRCAPTRRRSSSSTATSTRWHRSRTPRVRRAAPRACPDAPVLYAEMQGRRARLRRLPVVPHGSRDRRHRAVPALGARAVPRRAGHTARCPSRKPANSWSKTRTRSNLGGGGLRRHARGGGVPRRRPGVAVGQRHPEGLARRLLGRPLRRRHRARTSTSSGAGGGRASSSKAAGPASRGRRRSAAEAASRSRRRSSARSRRSGACRSACSPSRSAWWRRR